MGRRAPQSILPDRAHPNGPTLFARALPRALTLVRMVREEDAAQIGRVLDPLTYEETAATIVALAALVPEDHTVPDLLAWVDHQAAALRIVR